MTAPTDREALERRIDELGSRIESELRSVRLESRVNGDDLVVVLRTDKAKCGSPAHLDSQFVGLVTDGDVPQSVDMRGDHEHEVAHLDDGRVDELARPSFLGDRVQLREHLADLVGRLSSRWPAVAQLLVHKLAPSVGPEGSVGRSSAVAGETAAAGDQRSDGEQ